MPIKILHHDVSSFTFEALACKWQSLEKRAHPTVFLSWPWISTWFSRVKELNHTLFLVEATLDDNVVGLGIFVEKKRKVLGCFPITQWLLHRTGDQLTDQIWIEHNDFLLDGQHKEQARKAIVEYLVKEATVTYVAEFVIGLSKTDVIYAFKQSFRQATHLIDSPGYTINLSDINESYTKEVLSKNTRSQINRSIKLLNQDGIVDFNIVTDPIECQKLLPIIGEIHQERWKHTKEGSGFSNAEFVSFHQQLMASNKQCVEISILSLNGKNIGYLLNYLSGGHVAFYLSALKLSSNNKIKVGLVLHTKAIQHYVDKNYDEYDFLGGASQYKQSLSNQQYPLFLMVFSRYSAVLTVEKWLKKTKQALTKSS